MKILRQDDLISLAHGATFLGTGGGGSLTPTLEMIERRFSRSAEVRLLSVDEAIAPEEDERGLTVVSSFIGSQSANVDLTDITPAVRAAEAMDRLCRERTAKGLARTIPFELGAQSTAIPSLLVAAELGLDAVDADGSGRAAPVLPASLYAGAGLDPSPTVLTNASGATVVVDEADPMATHEVAVSVVGSRPFSAVAGMCLWPMDAAGLARAIPAEGGTRGSVSLAIEVGAELRRGSLEGALERLRDAGLDCQVIFRGHLESRRTTETSDHLVVTFASRSRPGEKVRRVVAYSVSETFVLRDQDEDLPLVLAPDSVCYATPDGRPLSNTELPETGEVVLVAVSSRRALVTRPSVLETFEDCLRQVGFAGAYRPFRELQGRGAMLP